MKTIRDVIFKIVVLSVLWFGVAIFLLWDAIFNDRNILSIIFECWQGIGGILGVIFIGFVWFGLIGGPFFVVAVVWAYIKDPDSCWSAKDTKPETED